MGLANFLVDLAAVAQASRSVASRHVALRARQLERYGKTSSIAASSRPGAPQSGASQQLSGSSGSNAQAIVFPSEEGGSASHTPIHRESSSAGEAAGSSTQPDTVQKPDAPHSSPVGGPLSQPSHRSVHAPVQSTPRHVLQPRGHDRVQTKAGPSRPAPAASVFVPAPWAATNQGTTRQGPLSTQQGRLAVNNHQATAKEEQGLHPSDVDINVFRTSRGSKILESLPTPGKRASPPQDDGSEIRDPSPATSAGRSGPAEVVNSLSATAERASGAPSARQETAEHGAKTPELSTEDANLLGEQASQAHAQTSYQLRESKVPATRISRLWNYGSLAAGMFAGAVGEGFSRAVGGGGEGSMMLSPANMERLVSKLSRMRGAALKMGQMMSFQDAKMLPGPIQEVLQRVQDRADYMPSWQRDKVLTDNLGPDWRDVFDKFEDKPIAAASIGQVHRASLRSNGAEVAVKIQFPGVADSINSDLDNLGMLLAATRLLPKGLYLDKTIENARTELAWECDYEREAKCSQRYRELLVDEGGVFVVPKVYAEACGKHVLTMEYMEGTGVTRMKSFTQEQRDWIGTQILRLCLREITEFKFMQTDPNWTNFLYNSKTNKLELLDFGASREYPDEFITRYVQLLEAASRSDREAVKVLSEGLGYLTGHESKAMLDAHVSSVLTLAEPFLASAPEVYDFSDQTITERVKALIPIMVHERLAPPPEETYSLHRKLSGAFLLCARLGSKVRCRDLFERALEKRDVATR